MGSDIVSKVISSRSRLKIADLLSIRPRTLKELAELTGISVPGVLKHLSKLRMLGLLQQRKVSGGVLQARTIYSIRGAHIGDFSVGDLTVVKLTQGKPGEPKSRDPIAEIQSLAEDSIVQRRRIREQSRRLGRLIDDLVQNEGRLSALVESLQVNDNEKILLLAAFTEETMEEAEKSLSRHHGLIDPRKSIDRALANAKRNAKR